MISCVFRKIHVFIVRSSPMKYDVLSISPMRKVILCGAHVYPNLELHPDRIMQEHDLMYVVEGEWRVFQDNVLYHLRAGDMFFLRAGSHHYTPYLCAAGSRNMFIHFNRLPEDRYEVDISANKLSAYANNAEICLPTLLHCGDATPIPSILKTIIDIFWSRRDDQQRTLTLQLNILLNELSYIARNTPPVFAIKRNGSTRFSPPSATIKAAFTAWKKRPHWSACRYVRSPPASASSWAPAFISIRLT